MAAEQPGELEAALAGVERLYTTSFRRHGVASQSVGWPEPASQVLRFDKLAYLIDRDAFDGEVAVNDWGCGYGAMFRYLAGKPGLRLGRYYGYDLSVALLEAARGYADDPRAEFIESGGVLHDADYSFVSGTFNVRMDATDAVWRSYVERQLLHLADRSRRGFAFNLLSSYVDWKKDDLFYAEPGAFFDFCKRNISRYVSLLHDYPLYEWTIVVLHESAAADVVRSQSARST